MTTAAARHILVAEDNAVLSNIICFNLKAHGFTVTAAHDGEEAAAYLRRQTFDLLITDYQMPGLTGADLCALVREELQNDTLPIIACSAKRLELDTTQFQAHWKVVQVFSKPFSLRELVRVVAQCLPPSVPAEEACPALSE